MFRHYEWYELEIQFVVRCVAHVLALVVKDAVLLYHKSISRIRSVIKYVTCSPSRLAKFKECAALEKIDCKKMVFLDVKTRWNATYLMLEAAIPYEKVFKRLEREDKSFRDKYIFKEYECEALPNTDDDTVVIDSEDYFLSSSSESECKGDVTKTKNRKKKNKPRHHAPYAADWSYARSLVKCLKIFFDATVKFFASIQVTTHEFLWQLALIHEQLFRLRVIGNRDYHISRMAEVMFRKYNTYWGDYEDMNYVLFFSKLLDPREKESGLKFDLECLYEQDDFRVGTVLKTVKQDMGKLYEEYNTMYSNANVEEGTGSTTVAGVDDMVVCVQEENIEDMLESRKKRRRMNVHSNHPKSELESYLLDDCETSTGDFDILAWWQDNSTKYKVLSLTVKDILEIPVSSVASESAFSTGKRILTPWISSLSGRTVETLLCMQSWLQKPICLDFICDYVPYDNANIEEDILGKDED
ncbi:zinc finger BED domain-containing protein RICESLEEPER 2-like [Papaver somniferum]|uniref:zinc finger BED domain-containing protein RICESLEEPER 2-like n=1 Tax=Papaver somniferum TaxID=3469 RepID=UPI000E6FB929|nr:zinc finger BED domain-containing protein RICESLEEPER 2-like [Papaver somniferum]